MPRFTHSIVFKISVAILVLETLVLAAMGHFYVTRFHREVDSRIRTAAQFPGTLMDERALSFDAARDLAAMSRLVGEEVIEAAVVRADGQVFYASDRGKEDFSAADAYGDAVARAIRPEHRGPDLVPGARAQLISVTPIRSDGKLIGFLYLKVDTRRSETEKKNILVLFTLGSLLCILLTTLAEVVIVHYLISPRIRRTVDCLEAVEGGDLAARVARSDSDDEIGVMQRSVNDMVAEVETLVGEVQEVNRQARGGDRRAPALGAGRPGQRAALSRPRRVAPRDHLRDGCPGALDLRQPAGHGTLRLHRGGQGSRQERHRVPRSRGSPACAGEHRPAVQGRAARRPRVHHAAPGRRR